MIDRIFIVIKYHKNPDVHSDKELPVLMMDPDGHPLEFDRETSAIEMVELLNMNSNQGFHYQYKELGIRYMKISRNDKEQL